MTTIPNHYRVLGVRRAASGDEIKQAYRRHAFANHADRNQGDREAEARCRAAQAAYEVLRDPEQRDRSTTPG